MKKLSLVLILVLVFLGGFFQIANFQNWTNAYAYREDLEDYAKKQVLSPEEYRKWIEFKEEKEKKEKEQKREKLQAELKKYKVEATVGIGLLEANPFEFEGKRIATEVSFKRMLTRTSGIFFSGYRDSEYYTNVPDEIIVYGIPPGIHFGSSGFGPPNYLIALEGKGTTEGTNGFGAKIQVPLYLYLGVIAKVTGSPY